MKKTFLLFFAMLVLGATNLIGQGLENFANFTPTSNSYVDGSFTGQDGSVWSFWQCRGDIIIAAPSPTLGKARTPVSTVESGNINGGCGTLSFDYMQAFSTNVNLDVYVNDILVGNVTSNAEVNIIKNSGAIQVNSSGTFKVKFTQKNTSSGQVTIDNITWTAYGAGPLPEPTNYPTAFAATSNAFSVSLNWADATGAQLPQYYLIKASTQNNITAPVDGTPVADDLDFSNGNGAKNVAQGVQSYTFSGLDGNKTYYFKIYPYTNTGSNVNFKTDGTTPSANATTPNLTLIHGQNFNNKTFGTWTTFSVIGDQLWTIDTLYGVGSSACARMSGYSTAAAQNEDWLISPALNFNNYHNEKLMFQTAKNYTGDPLQVMISEDYSGTGNPNAASWDMLQVNLSAGGWVWTPSGTIDINDYNGSNVRVAFKYTSNSTAAATWEVDNIEVYGEMGTGIENSPVMTFNLYPNPAQGYVKIQASKNAETLRVYSLLGALVAEYSIHNGLNQINIDIYKPGMYLFVVSSNNETSAPQKVIVK
ncbi:MAG: choice-of-anchor J domain-containing protein [Bacteroidales bacterium]|nr:choice-of-anchor J domain-containing protein [Bacteroidales bacterium]